MRLVVVVGVERLARRTGVVVDRDWLVEDDERGGRRDRGRGLDDEEPPAAAGREEQSEDENEQASAASEPAAAPEAPRLLGSRRRGNLLGDGGRGGRWGSGGRWLDGHRRGTLAGGDPEI